MEVIENFLILDLSELDTISFIIEDNAMIFASLDSLRAPD
jgi:hypothetical protein